MSLTDPRQDQLKKICITHDYFPILSRKQNDYKEWASHSAYDIILSIVVSTINEVLTRLRKGGQNKLEYLPITKDTPI